MNFLKKESGWQGGGATEEQQGAFAAADHHNNPDGVEAGAGAGLGSAEDAAKLQGPSPSHDEGHMNASAADQEESQADWTEQDEKDMQVMLGEKAAGLKQLQADGRHGEQNFDQQHDDGHHDAAAAKDEGNGHPPMGTAPEDSEHGKGASGAAAADLGPAHLIYQMMPLPSLLCLPDMKTRVAIAAPTKRLPAAPVTVSNFI